MSAFRSFKRSLGLLGTSASLFCSIFVIKLQKKGPVSKVRDFVCQINVLRSLKKLVTTIKFKRAVLQ